MRWSIDAVLMWVFLAIALIVAWRLVLDCTIVFGFVNFEDPHHRDPVEALMNSPLAPLLHLAIFVGSIQACSRFRRRTIEWLNSP